jgi:hypothetical protein
MTLEPDMHARLIAHLDSAPQRLDKACRHPSDNRVLGS